jgi:hypothetical protein
MNKVLSTILSWPLLLGIVLVAIAGMGSPSYLIPASTVSSGGATMNSASYQMTATVGQSSCLGFSSKKTSVIYAGFWQPTELKLGGKAIPWIPLLLLDN